MSTRATIAIETKEEKNVVSIYKHNDGYVKGGLGQALMEFVLYAMAFKTAEKFIIDFVEFCREQEGDKYFGFRQYNFERIDSDFWPKGQEFKSHSDTEYHYTLAIGKDNKSYFLFVQKRDWENGAQNGASQTETGHWTDFADKELIGKSGLLFDHKIA